MLPSNSDGIEALYGLIFYLIRIWGCQTYDLVAGNKFLFYWVNMPPVFIVNICM